MEYNEVDEQQNQCYQTTPPVYQPDTDTAVAEATEDEEYDAHAYGLFDEEDAKIRGWLAWFLWVGVGAGALVSFLSMFIEGLDDSLPSSVTQFEIGYAISILALGVYTIVAFFRRRPDAVWAGKAYTIMIALSGIIQICFFSEYYDAPEALRPFSWGLIWFAFLCTSQRVEARIPENTRKPGIIVPILAFCTLAFTIVFYYNLKVFADKLTIAYQHQAETELLDAGNLEYSLTQSDYVEIVDMAIKNTVLPQTLSDELTLTALKHDGDKVVCTIKMVQIYKSATTSESREAYKKEIRPHIIDDLKDPESRSPLEDNIIKAGLDLEYAYTDAAGKPLITISVPNSEVNE